MQGAVLEAELLQRAGYPAWTWKNRALLRAAQFLYNRAGWPADVRRRLAALAHRLSLRHPLRRASRTTHPGKNFGWTDWLYGTRVKGATTWAKVGDGSRLVRYVNGWFRLAAGSYSDARIHAARRIHAKAVLTFGGGAVVWIGTKGPTQGRAAVYIDGRRVRVVNLHSAFRQYHVRLFSYTFSRAGTPPPDDHGPRDRRSSARLRRRVPRPPLAGPAETLGPETRTTARFGRSFCM